MADSLPAALLTLSLFYSVDCQQRDGKCVGSLGGCMGKYDFTYDCKGISPDVPLECDLGLDGKADIIWYRDGNPMPKWQLSKEHVWSTIKNTTSLTNWTLNMRGDCGFRIYNLTCSANGTNSSMSTYVCATYGQYEPSSFKPFRNSSTVLAPKVLRPDYGGNVSLVCEDTFDDSRWLYNYSAVWLLGQSGSWSEIKATSDDITCLVYNQTIVRSTLTITNVTRDLEYACVLTKSDSFNNSTETLHYSITPLLPSAVLTVDQIAGISASVSFLFVIGLYVTWRFWIPLRSFVHHTCSTSCLKKQAIALYDAVVLFDENGDEAADFVYKRLRQKLEDEWNYKLCLPGRDFQIGNDTGSLIVDAIDRSHVCLFVMDRSFFENRWCDAALQSSLRTHRKVLCLLLADGGKQPRPSDYDKQLAPLTKLGVVMKFSAAETKPSRLKSMFLPHYHWTRLQRRLPPNPELYSKKCICGLDPRQTAGHRDSLGCADGVTASSMTVIVSSDQSC